MPRPLRAAEGLECVFPIWFTQCGRAWFTRARPRPSHALTMPFFSRPRDSTTVDRRPVGYLPRSASSGHHAEFHEVVISSIPISDAGGQCETKHRLSWTRKRVVAAHYRKEDLLHCRTSSSDISGNHADFHEGHGTVGAGQGRGMACVN
jgi:hypothetical protein